MSHKLVLSLVLVSSLGVASMEAKRNADAPVSTQELVSEAGWLVAKMAVFNQLLKRVVPHMETVKHQVGGESSEANAIHDLTVKGFTAAFFADDVKDFFYTVRAWLWQKVEPFVDQVNVLS